MNKAFDLKCGHFCWSADSIISNNLFLKIHDKIIEGYQGVGSVGDTIQSNRKSVNFFINKKKNGIININSKELIKFALKNQGITNINNVIDNKLRTHAHYASRVCYENLNFRLSFGFKFHPLYLEPQIRITNQFVGSVDYALAPSVINLKKFYILNSFTEKELKKKNYVNFDLQDPVFFTLWDINKSVYNVHHLNRRITPRNMALDLSQAYFQDEKRLTENFIIQNWTDDKKLKKKIILLKNFRRQMLAFLFFYTTINFFNIIKYIFFKNIITLIKILVKKLLNILVKIFNFFVNKI
jgi:hypothetical protein